MIGFLLAAALQAAPAAAPVSATTPASTPVAAAKKRCKRQQETGSFVRATRVCHTEEEWRALERRDNIELDRMRDRTPINSQRPVGG